MKNLIFLIFLPILSFSQELDGYTTIDDYNNSSKIEEYTHYEDESNLPTISKEIKDQKNVNISSYDFIIIGRDTLSRDKYIYLKNSGYFTWGRPTHQGTSNNVPFYHSSYSSESIYRNGIVNFLHIRFD